MLLQKSKFTFKHSVSFTKNTLSVFAVALYISMASLSRSN